MTWRAPHALALALVILAVAFAPTLLLPAMDDASTLAPGVTDERVVTLDRTRGVPQPVAADAPVRFAFTRSVDVDPARDALVIVAPRVGYSNAEVDAITAFLRAGGRVLVADDGGVASDLLERLDAGVNMGRAHVYTPAFNGTPRHIVTLSTDAVPGLPPEVVLTRPALVTGGTPVLRAPELAWEDANDNARPDLDERMERGFVLAARVDVGAGALLVVGTPFAVDATRGPDASRALLAYASENGARTLVVDEAHRSFSDPSGVNGLLAGRAAPVVGASVLFLTTITVGAVALAPRMERVKARRRARLPRDEDPRVLAAVIGELDAE